MVTWNELVEEARAELRRAGVPEPEVSARWIARQATGTDAAEWLEVANRPANRRQLAAFDQMVGRRSTGEPLQYVLGSWGFRSLDLFLDRRVLIPRPETEVVAEVAMVEVRRVLGEGGSVGGAPDTAGVVVDLGTGSGAIGLSVASERPGTEVWLTDASAEALQVARANLAGLGLAGGRVTVAQGHWFAALPDDLAGRVAVAVSNPPYVAAATDLEPQVADWEPIDALVADDGGTAHLVELIADAPAWLTQTGALVLEMAPDQVDAMVARAEIGFGEVEPFRDLAERWRGLVARHPLHR